VLLITGARIIRPVGSSDVTHEEYIRGPAPLAAKWGWANRLSSIPWKVLSDQWELLVPLCTAQQDRHWERRVQTGRPRS